MDFLLKEDELAFVWTPWVIGRFLWGWQMDAPEGHQLNADPKAFLEGMHHQICQKLEEEILALQRAKAKLALKLKLQKDCPDGTDEFTDPVFRQNQEAVLQANEIRSRAKTQQSHQLTFYIWTPRAFMAG